MKSRNPNTSRAILLFSIPLIALIFAFLISCCVAVETNPITSKERTWDLLNIHESIALTKEIDFNSAKLVFFGDLHRGMGERDFFKDNRALWIEILKYYFNNKFSLVLIGDIEEGWGFQADNIPIILQWYKAAFDLEKMFDKDHRYYRIYGNHDDYYRSNLVGYGMDKIAQVYPAIIFIDKNSKKRIFVTHGCQGHGLHDAGDRVAAWGVFARFNWLLEVLPNKEKEADFIDKAEKIKADYDKHEQYLYDWANEKKYYALVAGHTHRSIFNLNGINYSYKVLKEDIFNNRFPLYSYYSDKEESEKVEGTYRSATVNKVEISANIRKKMLDELDKEERSLESKLLIQKSKDIRTINTEYYNPGCGYLSEIPCIEMKGGKMSLRYFKLNIEGKLESMNLDPKSKNMIRNTSSLEGEK